MNEKDLNVPKLVKKIQHNTSDRKNEKNTIPEALISNREKKSNRSLHIKKYMPNSTLQCRKRYTKTEIAHIVTPQNGIQIAIAHPAM